MGDYYFHRSDRKLLVVILIIIAILLSAIVLLSDNNQTTASMGTADSLTADSTLKPADGKRQHLYYAVETKKAELFDFDPNTADSTELLRLGLQPWQVRNIYKYRAKGGVYRKPTDFARLYGLTVKQYRALEPHIKISSDYLPAATLVQKQDTLSRDTLKYPVKISEPESITLNSADTNQLKRVPGIGSWFAKAIVRYGERLGGYASVEQLTEIEDFPKESLKYFTVGDTDIQQININKLSLNQLKRHPYINFYQAKAIIDYRRLYGKIKNLDDLKLNKHFDAQSIERLRPYIEY